MKVTIVIPNYNGQRFIKDCFDSLRRQTFTDFKTLVIDNASDDGSDKYLEENYPEAELVRMDKNYGFSAAVNKGIELSDTPYVILLNNDTETDENFVLELVNAIEKSDDIFSCSSKMISFNDREIMDDAGDMYNIMGWGFQRGVGQNINYYNNDADVFSACAGAAIYRRDVFNEIGMFDLKHFAYLEDIDLGYRARIFGYRNVYASKAIVYHVGSGTSGSKYNSFKVKLAARNNIYLIYKNMPLPQIILNMPFLITGFAVKYGFFKKIGYADDFKKGLLEGFRKFHKLDKVQYKDEHFKNYARIELELFKNMLIYVIEYMKRKV